MSRFFTVVFLLVAACVLFSCQHAPKPGYTEQPHIVKQRQKLAEQLLELLPAEKRSKAAVQEATWLADTAYKASAAIARYNDPIFVNWLNNRAVNTRKHYRHRGLCWHYQHDLYRELRRRPLKYYRLGCCVRDKGKGGEHHVVYVADKKGSWPQIVMLDAWWYAGRLVVEGPEEAGEWEDDPKAAAKLNEFYREGHTLPMEHWAMVRRGTRYNEYIYSDTREARSSAQYQYMQQQMKEGLKRRKGKPTDY